MHPGLIFIVQMLACVSILYSGVWTVNKIAARRNKLIGVTFWGTSAFPLIIILTLQIKWSADLGVLRAVGDPKFIVVAAMIGLPGTVLSMLVAYWANGGRTA